MEQATLSKTAEVGLRNAAENLANIERSIADLTPDEQSPREDNGAIVVGAGPSVRRVDSIGRIVRSGYKGDVIAVDRSLGPCLREGLIPNYVVTVDPARRHARWFGDLDPAYDDDRGKADKWLFQQVNKHGRSMKAIIATSVDPAVTRRCLDAGMEAYWWNPIYDDFDDPNSYTHRVRQLTGVPCMVAGGNAGTAAWVFAHAVLNKDNVAMVGIDLGYAPNTPPEETQYYDSLVELLGDRAEDCLIRVYNPYLKETWLTDPTFYWYRQGFLDVVQQTDCTTWNCTEGGTLFGKRIKFAPLETFMESLAQRKLVATPEGAV